MHQASERPETRSGNPLFFLTLTSHHGRRGPGTRGRPSSADWPASGKCSKRHRSPPFPTPPRFTVYRRVRFRLLRLPVSLTVPRISCFPGAPTQVFILAFFSRSSCASTAAGGPSVRVRGLPCGSRQGDAGVDRMGGRSSVEAAVTAASPFSPLCGPFGAHSLPPVSPRHNPQGPPPKSRPPCAFRDWCGFGQALASLLPS